jgi:hypothetical protein
MPIVHFVNSTLLEIENMKRPGGELRERTVIKLHNGKTVNTFWLFAEIVNDLSGITANCFDEHGNEYQAWNFALDTNRNLTAMNWFQI